MSDFLIIAICLAANAVFSAFEMAFITIEDDEVEGFDDKHKSVREKIQKFKNHPERTLSVIQIGITLVGAIAAAIGGTSAAETLRPYLMEEFAIKKGLAEAIAVIVVITPLTYFSVVFGELVPKTIALRYPERVLQIGTSVVYLIDRFLSPIVSFLEKSTSMILKILQLDREDEEDIPETVEIGKLQPYHRDYVYNLVALKTRKIKSVMRPWEKVNFLEYSETDDEVNQKIREKYHSRYPVIDGDVLVGIFHVKEWKEETKGIIVPWQTNLGPALKVSPEELVLDVFLKMQKENHHLAVVSGTEGQFLGVVTIVDIVEQILGKMKDDLERNKVTRLLSHRPKIQLKK